MKRKLIAKRVSAVALATVMATAPVSAFATELDGHWAKDTLIEWQSKGLITGFSDGTLKPNSTVTRAQFVKLANAALGYSVLGTINFDDVTTDDWFYEDVNVAVNAGYANGTSATTFSPNADVTREQAARFIYNALGLAPSSVLGFTDAGEISSWAQEAVGAMSNAGYLLGGTDGSFAPKKAMTRAEAVSFLDRVMKGDNSSYVEPDAENSVTIANSGEVLQDEIINGDLIISSSVGDGEVYLDNVTVNGNMYVQGGGSDSVYAKNVKVTGTVYVDKAAVRLEVSENTSMPRIEFLKYATLEGTDSFSGTIGTVTFNTEISKSYKTTIDVDVTSIVLNVPVSVAITSEVGSMTVSENATGAIVDLSADATVGTITANAGVSITGDGTIETLNANANGITVDKNLTIEEEVAADGVTTETSGTTSSSGGTTTGSSGNSGSSSDSSSGSGSTDSDEGQTTESNTYYVHEDHDGDAGAGYDTDADGTADGQIYASVEDAIAAIPTDDGSYEIIVLGSYNAGNIVAGEDPTAEFALMLADASTATAVYVGTGTLTITIKSGAALTTLDLTASTATKVIIIDEDTTLTAFDFSGTDLAIDASAAAVTITEAGAVTITEAGAVDITTAGAVTIATATSVEIVTSADSVTVTGTVPDVTVTGTVPAVKVTGTVAEVTVTETGDVTTVTANGGDVTVEDTATVGSVAGTVGTLTTSADVAVAADVTEVAILAPVAVTITGEVETVFVDEDAVTVNGNGDVTATATIEGNGAITTVVTETSVKVNAGNVAAVLVDLTSLTDSDVEIALSGTGIDATTEITVEATTTSVTTATIVVPDDVEVVGVVGDGATVDAYIESDDTQTSDIAKAKMAAPEFTLDINGAGGAVVTGTVIIPYDASQSAEIDFADDDGTNYDVMYIINGADDTSTSVDDADIWEDGIDFDGTPVDMVGEEDATDGLVVIKAVAVGTASGTFDGALPSSVVTLTLKIQADTTDLMEAADLAAAETAKTAVYTAASIATVDALIDSAVLDNLITAAEMTAHIAKIDAAVAAMVLNPPTATFAGVADSADANGNMEVTAEEATADAITFSVAAVEGLSFVYTLDGTAPTATSNKADSFTTVAVTAPTEGTPTVLKVASVVDEKLSAVVTYTFTLAEVVEDGDDDDDAVAVLTSLVLNNLDADDNALVTAGDTLTITALDAEEEEMATGVTYAWYVTTDDTLDESDLGSASTDLADIDTAWVLVDGEIAATYTVAALDVAGTSSDDSDDVLPVSIIATAIAGTVTLETTVITVFAENAAVIDSVAVKSNTNNGDVADLKDTYTLASVLTATAIDGSVVTDGTDAVTDAEFTWYVTSDSTVASSATADAITTSAAGSDGKDQQWVEVGTGITLDIAAVNLADADTIEENDTLVVIANNTATTAVTATEKGVAATAVTVAATVVEPEFTITAPTAIATGAAVNGVTASAVVSAEKADTGDTVTVTVTLAGESTAAGTMTVGLESENGDAGTITAPSTVTLVVQDTGTLATDSTVQFAFTFDVGSVDVDDLKITLAFESTAVTAAKTAIDALVDATTVTSPTTGVDFSTVATSVDNGSSTTNLAALKAALLAYVVDDTTAGDVTTALGTQTDGTETTVGSDIKIKFVAGTGR